MSKMKRTQTKTRKKEKPNGVGELLQNYMTVRQDDDRSIWYKETEPSCIYEKSIDNTVVAPVNDWVYWMSKFKQENREGRYVADVETEQLTLEMQGGFDLENFAWYSDSNTILVTWNKEREETFIETFSTKPKGYENSETEILNYYAEELITPYKALYHKMLDDYMEQHWELFK